MDITEKASKILKSTGFHVSGYYPYDHAINLVGSLQQPPPFDTPIRMAVEIAKSPISIESIESFAKFGNYALALKLAIFSVEDLCNLNKDIQDTLNRLKINYIGGKSLEKALSKSSVSNEEAKDYQNSLDILSPKRLLLALPELSQRKIPADINDTLKSHFKAWEIMEDAVFAAFLYAFVFETIKLGHEKRFHDEPEGIVVTRGQQPFAFLYDCKSTKDKYVMPVDDERAIVSYIENKKAEIKAKYRCNIRYFVVVSSSFGGDINLRRDNVYDRTNVILVLLEGVALSKLALWAHNLPPLHKELIDLKKIFKFGEKIIGIKQVKDYIKDFDNSHKQAYQGG